MTVTEPRRTGGRRSAGSDRSTRSSKDGFSARIRATAGSLRRATVDWLDRPMTSLHLILAIFALMLGIGLLMVLSSSAVTSYRTGGSSFSTFINQATYATIGLIGFFGAQYVPVKVLKSVSLISVIVSLVLLVAVLVPSIGALVNGARSWIRIGGFQFQPSEIAKLALLLWMAQVLSARR
ncbi:MAG TPA: FtsW/RodA/SpoVE family cell cycle protein, partial [Nakamurella sp.]